MWPKKILTLKTISSTIWAHRLTSQNLRILITVAKQPNKPLDLFPTKTATVGGIIIRGTSKKEMGDKIIKRRIATTTSVKNLRVASMNMLRKNEL